MTDTVETAKSLPLVSVVVVTYNSARYVKQTLDSVLNQTYQGPIELIVSDDGSQDDTVKICEEWMAEYSSSFIRSSVIRTPKNLGICGNYNFALDHVTGEWIKYIAGDDILSPESLSAYVDAALTTGDSIYISGVMCIDRENNPLEERYLMEDFLDSESPYVQAQNLAKHAGSGIIEGPTLFINAEFLKSMGGMDMTYPMLEDFPFAFRSAFSGHHIGVIKQPLVKYRIYPESISQSKEMFKVMYHEAMYDARMQVAWRERNYIEWWHHRVMKKLAGYASVKGLSKWKKSLLKASDIYSYMTVMKRGN